jgi:hypothetical protein
MAVHLVALSLAQPASSQGAIHLVSDGKLSAPEERALAELEKSLTSKGRTARRSTTVPDNGEAIIVGTPGASNLLKGMVNSDKVKLNRDPESLSVQQVRGGRSDILAISGSDARGLTYALLDVARAVELAPRGFKLFDTVGEASESPFLRTRTMSVHLFNKDLEAGWYFDEKHWRDYFAMLIRDRYNNFNVTFSDQTNYLTPLYAYLVEVPGFENVRAKGVTDTLRRRNLAMLQRIAELAQEHGLDFTLGIWAQAPVAAFPGEIAIENLPSGMAAAKYCAHGLKIILQACPAITGVQFRMNAESGVSEKDQADFFRIIFQALKEVGRPLKIDLRFKGLRRETIQAAIDAGLDVAVSIKFWCEHMGLPYHPTVADRLYRESRYSFGAILAKPRPFRITYQLWSMGSQRVLLWGDPDYAARFAQSCKLGDGEGFEVFAPLTNKGYSTKPGTWKLFADPAYEVGAREFSAIGFSRWSLAEWDTTRKRVQKSGSASSAIASAPPPLKSNGPIAVLAGLFRSLRPCICPAPANGGGGLRWTPEADSPSTSAFCPATPPSSMGFGPLSGRQNASGSRGTQPFLATPTTPSKVDSPPR